MSTTTYDGFTSYIVYAECPVEGFYRGSFQAMRGRLVGGPPKDEARIATELCAEVVYDLTEQLRWAGVKPEFERECLSRIEWEPTVKPAVIHVNDEATA